MFDFLFNPQGRVSRKGVWAFLLLSFAVQLAAAIIDLVWTGMRGPATSGATLFLLWPSIAVTVKRFHDRNMSGWWVLAPLLAAIAAGAVLVVTGMFAMTAGALNGASGGRPSFEAASGAGLMTILAGLALAGVMLHQVLNLYVLPGSRGSNDYGMDPRAPSAGFGSRDHDDGRSPIDRLKPKGQGPARSFAATVEPSGMQPGDAPPRPRNVPSTLPDWGFGRMHAGARPRSGQFG